MGSIEEIQHRRLSLTNDARTEERPHRPELGVWADDEDFDRDDPAVVLAIGPLFGEARRYVEMSPDEARALAALLTQVAGEIDTVNENRAELAYDRHQQSLMENGPGPSLLDQQREAMKFK